MRRLLLAISVALHLCCICCGHDGLKRGDDRSNNARDGGEIVRSDSHRHLQNKITSNHLISLEFSGVTYASTSLDIVKFDLVQVVEDVLGDHLSNRIEVIDVQRVNLRRQRRAEESSVLRIPSSRMLSYILLVVKVSLRHPSWISSERTLGMTIDILREYVDQDFRQYMQSLPGNGDYVGSVDVSEVYNDFSITAVTNKPTARPALETVSGSFGFELVFTGVSPKNSDSEVLRGYIQYAVTQILRRNLDADVAVVDVSLQPWMPKLFPMLITLQYPTSRTFAFVHAENVLRQNIGDLDLYLDDYLATASLSDAEMMELELALKDVFGEMVSIEIGKTSDPTPSPTKVPEPAKPLDWLQTTAEEASSEMPWWGWVIIGVASAIILILCCCCVWQCMRRKRTVTEREVTNNVIHVPESVDEPAVVQIRVGDNGKPKKSSKKVKRSSDIADNKITITMKESSGNASDHPYEPNRNAPDPEERTPEPKMNKKKTKKKKARDP